MIEYILDGFDNEIEKIATTNPSTKEKALALKHLADIGMRTPGQSLLPILILSGLGGMLGGRTGATAGAGLGLATGIDRGMKSSRAKIEDIAKEKNLKNLDNLKYVEIPAKTAIGGIGGLASGHVLSKVLNKPKFKPIMAALGALGGLSSGIIES